MLGNNSLKAVHTAASMACAAVRMIGRSDVAATHRRQSTSSSPWKQIPKQLPSATQSQLLNVSLLKNEIHIKSTISNASNRIFLSRFETQNSIPLPFVQNVHIGNAIVSDVKMQPLADTSLNNVIMYGLKPIGHFLLQDDKLDTKALPTLFCHDDPTEDSHRETYDCMNRNARYGKKANKGKRPCSRQNRRKRRRRFGNHRRG